MGEQVIRTTTEHPFLTQRKGWVPARELQPGDLLLSDQGQWVAMEKVRDSKKFIKLYNLRVAEYHTYFVGGEDWGFSVWAHNACVYQSIENDTVLYYGIADTGSTSTLSQRFNAAGVRTPGATTAVIPGTEGVTTLAAQQIEQALINYGGRQGIEAGGTLVNILSGVNVSPANTAAGYYFCLVSGIGVGHSFLTLADLEYRGPKNGSLE